MKIKSFLSTTAFLAVFMITTAFSLTVDQTITPAFVREHSDEFSVSVTKSKNGLITFTVVRTLSKPKYLVAHLTVRHGDKVIAESHTPSFSKENQNTFYFSLLPEHVLDSTFVIGESESEEAVPRPGTVNHQIRVRDFVTQQLLDSVAK